jgi:hypothetical protein
LASPGPDSGAQSAPVFQELSRAVEASGLEVALIGGSAVNTYEDPRYTKDIDLTVEAHREKIAKLVDQLEAEGFDVVRRQDAGELDGPDFVQLKRPATSDMIDVIVAKTEFQELVIERAVRAEGGWLPIATPEDLIVLKLVAGRPQDGKDNYLLARDHEVDWTYVERWAAEWDVISRLEALRFELREGRPRGA